MKFKADIKVMPLQEILDPQGKAVQQGLHDLNFSEIANVRVGKHITLCIEATNKITAQNKINLACKQLLANAVMEKYTFVLQEV